MDTSTVLITINIKCISVRRYQQRGPGLIDINLVNPNYLAFKINGQIRKIHIIEITDMSFKINKEDKK